jgi:hypothetical protein
MRFFRVLQNSGASPWRNDVLNEGDIICFSTYFDGIVVVSNGRDKTKHFWTTDRWKLNLLLSKKIISLTEKELNKIRPHLKKEHFNRDLI